MRLNRLSFLLFASCLSTCVATAGNFSFTGTFATDDQLEIFQFTAPTSGFMAETWSYAGGTNAAGQTILGGGFDPVLTLFDSTGVSLADSLFVDSNDNGVGVAAYSVTSSPYDSLLSISNLQVGRTYSLILSQTGNGAIGTTYGSGFNEVGAGNYTSGNCGGTAFCDGPFQADGHWAVDILNVATAVDTSAPTGTPEPGSLALLSTALAGLAAAKLRRRQV